MGIMQLLEKLFGGKSARDYKDLSPILEQVKEGRGQYAELDDDALRAKTDEFRERYSRGESTDDMLPEAFGVAWEACRRLAERKAS